MELVVNIDENNRTGHSAVCIKSGRVNSVFVDDAELRAGPTFGQGLYLVVSGPAPANGDQVRLVPDLVQHDPDYRRIEVLSDDRSNHGDDSPLRAERYEKSMPLSGLSGKKGIELVGANGTKKFDLMG